jgi:3-hydroxyacyl-CoA dehydrogenase
LKIDDNQNILIIGAGTMGQQIASDSKKQAA